MSRNQGGGGPRPTEEENPPAGNPGGITTTQLAEVHSNVPSPTEAVPTPWDALRGALPTCSDCGARVLHYSVRVCFHCRSDAQ
jgi:hypothetical protein